MSDTPRHMLTRNVLTSTLRCLLWIFLCPEMWIPGVGNTIRVNKAPSVRLSSRGCNHSRQRMPLEEVLCILRKIRTETITVQYSTQLCLCYASRPGSDKYFCCWVSPHFCHNITLPSRSCFHSASARGKKLASLTKTSVYRHEYCDV